MTTRPVSADELAAALRWALRHDGGECPADDPAGYVKAMEALSELEAEIANTPLGSRIKTQPYIARMRDALPQPPDTGGAAELRAALDAALFAWLDEPDPDDPVTEGALTKAGLAYRAALTEASEVRAAGEERDVE